MTPARITVGPGTRKFWRRMWSHPRTIDVDQAQAARLAIGIALVVFFAKLKALREAMP